MADLDYYFDWYRFSEKSRIQFTIVRIYWTSVQRVYEAWDFHRVLGGNKKET